MLKLFRLSSRRGRRAGWRLRVIAPLAALGLIAAVAPAAPALAASPAAVTVQTSITDLNDVPITSVNATGGATPTNVSVSYRVHVAYSCSLVDCTDVQVSLAGTALDPTYGTYHRETGAYTFNPPFTPQPPISGSVFGGFTVDIGDMAAGTSGTFSIDYQVNDGHRGDPAGGSFFANGSTIQPQATITASNADTKTDSSATASWVSAVPDPILNLGSMGASVRTDTPYNVTFGPVTTSGCVTYTSTYGTLLTYPERECATSYALTTTLPATAQYVAGSGGAAGAAGTVVIQNSGRAAAIGPNSSRPNYANDGAFQVVFPSADYPTTGAGCIATETFSFSLAVTYIDGTQKTVTGTRQVQVQNCTPFAKANITKWSATGSNVRSDLFDIPTTPGTSVSNGSWRMEVDNQSNVAGIATMSDTFGQADLPVYQLVVGAGGPATIDYTLSDGTNHTATVAQGAGLQAAAGTSITSMTATSGPLTGPNPQVTGTAVTPFEIFAFFTLSYGATPGTRTNTVTGSVSYPGFPGIGPVDLGPFDHTLTLRNPTDIDFVANAPTAAVTGGGTALVGSQVVWSQSGQMTNLPSGSTITPQYVFLAPKGWTIAANGASLAPDVPGATYTYRTVTYNGDSYDGVVVNWPAPTGQIGTANLPTLKVTTSPTGAAPAGTSNQTALFFVGDVNGAIVPDYTPGEYVDAADLDADGSTSDGFAAVTGVTSLAPSRAVAVTKEICKPDALAADGCDWIANSSVTVGVAPSATSIKYRVTLRNTGNVGLTNLVGYDVLPFVGDTGTSDAAAGTPRGSSVREQVSAVTDVDPAVTLAYSTSTNPPRSEVYSGATTGDWTAPLAGASAIRATVPSLAAQASVTFVYTAALVGASADKVACNSVAVKADLLTPIEPAAVCATTQEADFAITAAPHLPLQEGRDGTATFTVTNGGPSSSASGTVTLSVPAGLTITSTTVPGWDCSAPSTDGPVDVTCTPVNGDGTTRSLTANDPETIPLGVHAGTGFAGTSLCIDATVAGLMFDPDATNNAASSCAQVLGGATLLGVGKTDGETTVGPGETLTYTITGSNLIVAQDVTGAVLTDALPATVAFVSASDGGTLSGADGDGNGGTVTWPAADLAASGVPNADGDGTGAAGSSVERTVTVRIVDDAVAGSLVNTASLTAADPSDPATTLTASGDDTDTVAPPVPTVDKRVTSSSRGADGVWTVVYEIDVTDDGTWGTQYTLDDAFDFAPGTVVVGTPTVTSTDTTVSTTWNGGSDDVIVADPVVIAAGATHRFTVTVQLDPAAVDDHSALADCTLDAGETGTGFRTVATLDPGALATTADACIPFVAPDADPAPAATAGSASAGLASTGVTASPYLIGGAALLILLGAAAVLVPLIRRRRDGRTGA